MARGLCQLERTVLNLGAATTTKCREIGKRTMKTLLAGVAFAIAVAFSSQASAFPYCTKITWHGNYYVCTIDEE
jgi:hypothetical protein